MNNDQGYEKRLSEARTYAMCIIQEVPGFYDFAVNMLDYLGKEYCQEIKAIYKELSAFLFEHGIKQDDFAVVDGTEEVEMCQWLDNFRQQQEQQEQNRQDDFDENIDELQFLVKRYRTSEDFQKMIDFVGKFRHLAPYNAMLVELQKPGASIVLKGKEWLEFNRMIKPNAQQLITLRQFGPVQCMFDLSDTEPIPGLPLTEANEILERWNKSLMSAQGEVSPHLLQRLIDNLPSYGVFLDVSFSAANTYGGYITEYSHQIKVPLGLTQSMSTNSRFLISINRAQKDTDKFHTICHELGHLFCRHMYYDREKCRELTLKEREFEAESVAWIVCKRHGINNPSEQYLASYAPTGEIPLCSTDYILKAVTEIEKMLSKSVYGSQSIWYKEDKAFKAQLDKYKRDMSGKGKKSPNTPKTIFDVSLLPLPYEEQPNQVIYVESSYDEEVNNYIRSNYYSIQNCFRDSGKEFIYIPIMMKEIQDEGVIKYNAPYAKGFKDLSISSDFLLQFLSRPQDRKGFPPSLVFPVVSSNGRYIHYRAIALDKASGYQYTNNLSNILVEINRKSGVKNRSKVFEHGINDGFSENIYAGQVDKVSHPQSSEILDLLDEAKTIINKLKRRGVSEYVLRQLIYGEEKLSRLHVTKDYRIFLPDYGNCEITMGPLPKTVFFFFLRHKEGVRFKELSDYRDELMEIYKTVKGNLYSASEAKASIDDITNPTKNAINENCSRIRKAFISKFDERLAQSYYVTGRRTEKKQITLPGDMITWDENNNTHTE